MPQRSDDPGDVPLSPQAEALLKELTDIHPPSAGGIRIQLQKDANRQARRRRLFREQLAPLLEAGMPAEDAVDLAQRLVAGRLKFEALEARQRAGAKRIEAASRSYLDKFQRRLESKPSPDETARRRGARQPQRDKQLIDILGKHQKRGVELPCPLVAQEINSKIGRIHVPTWEKTSIVLRATGYALQTHHEGGYSLNMNIAPSVEVAARNSKRGASSFIQDRIRKALIKEFGENDAPDFWLVVEASRMGTGRLHVHGGISADLANLDLRPRIQAALVSAGGGWHSPTGRIFATHFRLIEQPLTWASYCLKDVNFTGREVSNRLVTSTAGIRRRAQDRWSEMRSLLQSFFDA